MTTANLNMDTAGSSAPLLHEILTKVNNAKDKPAKIAVLKKNDSVPLRQVLKGAFDPNIKWALPEGTPPYKENDAPAGTEHTTLFTEARRLWHFVEGADNKLPKTKKEMMDKIKAMYNGMSKDALKNSYHEIMKIPEMMKSKEETPEEKKNDEEDCEACTI